MFNKKFVTDTLSVLGSNLLVLLSGIVTGLVVPKFLGLTDYGYYKIFNLYIGYTALFHFGFVDGILLLYAGQAYDKLDRNQFKYNSQFFLCFQLLICLIISIISFTMLHGIYQIIFLLVGLDTFANNVTSYYQYISQSTLRFRELSFRKILQAILRIVTVIVLLILKFVHVIPDFDFYTFMYCWVAIDVILTLWYMWTYRDLTFGKVSFVRVTKSSIFSYFRQGIVLTVAYQVANLIFSLDRQYVSIFFATQVYAVYSFAYTLISMVTTLINAVSLVLFPNLKRQSNSRSIQNYGDTVSMILMLVFLAMIGYFPLCEFIRWYLPDYSSSLVYLRVLFPGLAINSVLSAVVLTYYKLLEKSKLYFILSLVILLIAALLNYLAYVLFKSPLAISVSSLVILLLWYVLAEGYLALKYHIEWRRNISYLLVLSFGFYTCTSSIFKLWGMVFFAAWYLIVTLVLYKKLSRKLLDRILLLKQI